MLLVERPALASEPPASDPKRMPVKTQVLENEMTAPRRSGGDLHWRMAFSGTKMKEQQTPRSPNIRNVPTNGGVSRAEQGQCDGRAHGSQGDQSVFNSVLRQSPDQHGADADADGQQREREPRHRVREMQNGFGIDENVLGEEARDRPEKYFSWNGKAQQAFCLNGSPGNADRRAHAAGRAGGRDVGNGKGGNQADY